MAKRNSFIEETLKWSWQQGYTGARAAADAYTELADCAFVIRDLGLYGDTLEFYDTPEAALAACEVVSGRYNPNKMPVE